MFINTPLTRDISIMENVLIVFQVLITCCSQVVNKGVIATHVLECKCLTHVRKASRLRDANGMCFS